METSSKFTCKIRKLAIYISAICVLFLIQEDYYFFLKQVLDCISAQAPQKAITRPKLKKRLLLNLLWAHLIANPQAPVLQAGRPPLGQFNPNHRAGIPLVISKTNDNLKFKHELKAPYFWWIVKSQWGDMKSKKIAVKRFVILRNIPPFNFTSGQHLACRS